MLPSDWSGDLRLSDGAPLRVQLFEAADLEAIFAIETRSHAFPWKRVHFEDSLRAAHHHCLGVRAGGEWAGYAIISCLAGEAELLLIVIDQSWQGRGLGAALLEHLVKCLQGRVETVFLEVRETNERAINLYENAGFNQVGVRHGYYRSAGRVEDAIIYACSLG